MSLYRALFNVPNIKSQENARSTVLKAVAKANNLELELVHTEPSKGVDTKYLLLNHLGKVPTFQGTDGYVLTECIAIAIYRTLESLALEEQRQKFCEDEQSLQSQLSLTEISC